jgi:transcriptional regulator with XRE-family HTH domain
MSIDSRSALNDLIKNGAYNQAAIAKKAGLTPSQLSGILNKRRKMDSDEMFALCDVLNITPERMRSNGKQGSDRQAS